MAHTRPPQVPSRWRPRYRQHRLVQLLSVRKCTRRPIIASLLSTTLLSATSVAPVSFTIHAPPTNFAYVVDAAQVSTSLRSRGPVAQSLKLVLLGWSAKVDLQPRLDRDAAVKYISEYASEPETVSDGYHHALDDFCARMRRKTRSDVSSPGWPQQTGTSPHKRPFTCCSATISSTHDTCSEITTMPMMTTVPPRHPSSPATKQPGKPLPLDYQGGVEVCALHSIG